MLPFIRKKAAAGLIVSHRKPDGGMEEQAPASHEEGHHGLDACSQDLIDAIANKDIKGVSAALRAASALIEADENNEGPHTYQAQNEIAAKIRRD